MKKILLVLVSVVMLIAYPMKRSYAQTYCIPISFHILNNSTDWSLATPAYLQSIICDVNKTFSGQYAHDYLTAHPGSGFPTAYNSLISNANMVFYLDHVDRAPGNWTAGATGVPQPTGSCMTLYNRNGIDVFLYDFAAGPDFAIAQWVAPGTSSYVSQCGGSMSGFSHATSTYCIPCAGLQDVIIMSKTAFTTDPRGVLSHEIGHYFGLQHIYGGSYAGWCHCGSGGSCMVTDAPPGGSAAMTGSCNWADATNMSQNVMQGAGSCLAFFTPQQTALMRSEMPAGLCKHVLDNPSMLSFASSGTVIPSLTFASSGSPTHVTVVDNVPTTTSCGGTGVTVYFKVRFYMPNCANGGFMYNTPSYPTVSSSGPTYSIVNTYIPWFCHYQLAITAVFSNGFTYNYPIQDYPSIGIIFWGGGHWWGGGCRCDQVGPSQKPGRAADGDNTIAQTLELTGNDEIDLKIHTPLTEEVDEQRSIANRYIDMNKLQIYPNPTNDKLYFKGADVIGYDYQVTNEVGQVIDQGSLKDNNISVSKLPAGMYFIRVKNSDGNSSDMLKFMKE